MWNMGYFVRQNKWMGCRYGEGKHVAVFPEVSREVSLYVAGVFWVCWRDRVVSAHPCAMLSAESRNHTVHTVLSGMKFHMTHTGRIKNWRKLNMKAKCPEHAIAWRQRSKGLICSRALQLLKQFYSDMAVHPQILGIVTQEFGKRPLGSLWEMELPGSNKKCGGGWKTFIFSCKYACKVIHVVAPINQASINQIYIPLSTKASQSGL